MIQNNSLLGYYSRLSFLINSFISVTQFRILQGEMLPRSHSLHLSRLAPSELHIPVNLSVHLTRLSLNLPSTFVCAAHSAF